MERSATVKSDPFDNTSLKSVQPQGDLLTGVRSGETTWSDIYRSLSSPPVVRHAEKGTGNDSTVLTFPPLNYRGLASLELVQPHAQQEKAERTPKKALKLHENPQEGSEGHKFPLLPVLAVFHSSDCKLNTSYLPDGTFKTVQTAPDGSTRTQVRLPDGRKEAKVADRYGRPVLMEHMNTDGTWTVAEMNYPDTAGRPTPFVASKRITRSDGTVAEIDYSRHGKVASRRDYNV